MLHHIGGSVRLQDELSNPTIAQDGVLKMPIRKDDGWYFPVSGINYKPVFIKVDMYHPYCDEYGF